MAGRLQFDEAIQFSQVRLKIPDPELKQGKVDMIHITTPKGLLERPWGEEGGFAIVYKFRTKSGHPRALRCFKSKLNPDTLFRYERLSIFFRAHARDITADFQYHDTGLLVKEQPQDNNYSILDMEWIEGVTLLDKIDELCKKRDRVTLGQLADQWVAILRTLRREKIAHGDMAGNNVMVRQDGKMILIDYDGVYIPEFANRPSAVAGQVDYQHPQFGNRQFNEWMDDFSALVIYTALLATHLQPDLWAKYVRRDALDLHLMFRHDDFKDHTRQIWRDLDNIHDPRLKEMVQALKQACKQPVESVRFPFDRIDPDFDKKRDLAELEKAINGDDDEQIARYWGSNLETYGPAQQYRQRVVLAQQRVLALKTFRIALKKHNMQQIVADYDPALNGCKALTREEQDRLQLASAFVQAYNIDDDDALVAASDAIQNSLYTRFLVFTAQEKQRIDLARKRQAALLKFRVALHGKRIQDTVSAYDPTILDTYKSVSSEEQKGLELARNFILAYNADDDDALLLASNEIENFIYSYFFEFTLTEKRRIDLAQQRKVALARFVMALDSKNVQRIVTIYDGVLLDDCKSVTPEERERLALAHDFALAYNLEHDERLLEAYEAIQRSSYSRLFTFTPQEEQRIQLARQYTVALAKFRQSLASKNAFQIVAAYDRTLDDYKSVTPEEREHWQVACNLVEAYKADDDKALAIAYEEIQNIGHHQQFFSFTPQEKQRIQLAQQRKAALVKFQVKLMGNRKCAQDIVNAYDPSLLDACKNVTVDEREQLKAAQDFLQMYVATLEAIKANNNSGEDDKIVAAYNEELASQFTDFTEEQQQRISRAVDKFKLKQALQMKSYGLALRLAGKIEEISHEPIEGLIWAKRKYIRTFDARDLTVRLQGNEVVACWQWPIDDLVKYAALLWRTDTWPHHPKKDELGTVKYHINRSSYEQEGSFKFSVGQSRYVYIQVYLAIPDYSDRQINWYYSSGDEATARRIARPTCTVQYRLIRNAKPQPDELEIATSDGSPLPDLVIVRKAGNLPLVSNDGDVVTYVNGMNGRYQHRVLVPLDTTFWPGRSIIRVFPAYKDDTDWLTVVNSQGAMIEVN